MVRDREWQPERTKTQPDQNISRPIGSSHSLVTAIANLPNLQHNYVLYYNLDSYDQFTAVSNKLSPV